MKQFYSHLIDIESIIISLDELNLSDREKVHLSSLIDSNLHTTILDAVMSELSEEDKMAFLKHLSDKDHDRIWELLNNRVDKVEEKIKTVAQQMKQEIHKDINEAKFIYKPVKKTGEK